VRGWFALALLVNGVGMAQSNCTSSDTASISGLVVDAGNGRPIAAATIHYRAQNGDENKDENGAATPNTLGAVTTAANGSYTITCLKPGTFNLRATAAGYFGARDVGEARLADDKPGTDSKSQANGVLRLRPDLLNLQPIAASALARLNAQGDGYSSGSFPAPVFSADGSRIAFLVPEAVSSKDAEKNADKDEEPRAGGCSAVAYDLASGRMNELSGSLPVEYCDVGATEMVWDGDAVYVCYTNYNSDPPEREAMRIGGGNAKPAAIADLPKALAEKLTRKSANGRADREAEAAAKAEKVETTGDGLFTVRQGEGELEQCNSIVAASKQPAWEQTVATCAFPFESLLDRNRDLLFYTERASLVEMNLKTRVKRSFLLPESDKGPDLLATQALGSGATRMIYAMVGEDCDPAATERRQESDPPGICIVTIPSQ